jgi:hypothetical protein
MRHAARANEFGQNDFFSGWYHPIILVSATLVPARSSPGARAPEFCDILHEPAHMIFGHPSSFQVLGQTLTFERTSDHS